MGSKKMTWFRTRNTEYSFKETNDPRYVLVNGGNLKNTIAYTPAPFGTGGRVVISFPENITAFDKNGVSLAGRTLTTSPVQEMDVIELHDAHANDYSKEPMVTYFTTRSGSYVMTDANANDVRGISGPTFSNCEIEPYIVPTVGKPLSITFTPNPNNIDNSATRLSGCTLPLGTVQSVQRMTLNNYVDMYNKSIDRSHRGYETGVSSRSSQIEADLADIDDGFRAPELVNDMMQRRGHENFNLEEYSKSKAENGYEM